MLKQNMSICVSSLKKSYGNKKVLSQVNFSVPGKTVYALLGSNGAGKTTTIRILTGQIKADGGEVLIEGHDVLKSPEKVREVISLTGQFSAVDDALTGKENLVIMGRLRHLAEPEKRALELLNYFELSGAANQAVSTYSGGMKRKLDIAMSLVGNPKLIFLDEPTTGLDPQSRHSMWELIRELKRSGVTIFLTTQYLEEAEQLADIIAILDRGEIIAEGTAEELKAYLLDGAVKFIFEDAESLENAKQILKHYKTASVSEEHQLTVYTDGKADTLALIFHGLYENQVKIREFSQLAPDLEDVFLTMISEREGKFNEK
ncbi:ATP-binding cassette domain-containing protein [Cuneatibacter caecimuris]|uniref:ABC-2 type transport system ATP-binding protein n=1 Tax=Cuneatibacter caecimuris TaxID=1796618 RepID=A0A4Q7PPZ5_9FIRM|nr:ATP-binding cassette domain-containing protein [Cuneatibacter caecimuris]RZT02128.1 ABC-2 type transport system ATP-binding protein [Cuneatibacter caecimuris]